MKTHVLELRGVDPLLFRDGRPFGAELGAQVATSLPVPFPGVVAGAVRTMVGSRAGWDWSANNREAAAEARKIGVEGPVVCLDGKPLVHAPTDALIYEGAPEGNTSDVKVRRMVLRPLPLRDGEGCNLPEGMLPIRVLDDCKPADGYRFWPWDEVMDWLERDDGSVTEPLPPNFPNIKQPSTEERIHVAIGAGGVAEEHMLFTTSSVVPMERVGDGTCRPSQWSYRVRVNAEVLQQLGLTLQGPLCLGGERRLAVARQCDPSAWPGPSEALVKALSGGASGAKGVRMLLVTPAIFSGGWKAAWMAGGSPPGAADVKLTLRAACVPRHEAVSGWDYEKQRPKAVRWLVPAGSVFFFEADGDTSELVHSAWLTPVSDDEQDRLDGYGLAVWGIWNNEGVNG